MVGEAEPPAVAPPPTPRWRRPWIAAAALIVGLGVLATLSTLIGPESIPASATLSILAHQVTQGTWPRDACGGVTSANQCAIWVEIVWGARVPALFLAILAGAALG